jgi:hypothetical protein
MSRPRGFAPWRPHADSAALITEVRNVLDEYRDHLPLTLRQIFYRLVGKSLLPKHESAYSRLCELMNRARRAGLVDFEAIRDDGVTIAGGSDLVNRQDVIDLLKNYAQTVTLDRQAGQPQRLQIWCEAAGMVPQLRRVADPYGVPVISSGGFDSLTVKHDMGRQLAERPTVVLHIGDHDPSGVHMFSSLAEDVQAFAEAYAIGFHRIEFVRLAVTPEQALDLDLPSTPPKATDNRSFSGADTWQCEALPPDELARIVETAITDRLDGEALAVQLAVEADVRRELVAWIGGAA